MRSDRSERQGNPPPALFLLLGCIVLVVALLAPSLYTQIVLPPSTPAQAVIPAAALYAPMPTSVPLPTPFPTPLPAPALSPLPTPPAIAGQGVFIVLELTSSADRAVISDAFDLLRQYNLRTVLFATPDVHPDYIRLAIADGHQIALRLRGNLSQIQAQTAAWEALLERVVGPAGLPMALLPEEVPPDQDLADELADLGYHLVSAGTWPVSAGEIVRVSLGPDTGQQLEMLTDHLSSHSLALFPHWMAAVPESYPSGEQATTAEAFRAAHIIIIDPGHTEVDVGAGIPSAEGAWKAEYWANLVRAAALQGMLQADGWMAVLTHDDDALFNKYSEAPDIDLSRSTTRPDDTQFRANFAYYLGMRTGRRPVVISLHVDSNSSSDVWGPVFFYPPGGDERLVARSYRLALSMQDHLAAFWEEMGVTAPSRGVRVGFPDGGKGRAGSGYDILGTTHIEPAPGADTLPSQHYVVTLVEAGTATHLPEGYVMSTVEGNQRLGQAHRDAIHQWMMTELALVHMEQNPHCPDPDALTAEEIEFLAAQEVISGQIEEPIVALTFDAGSGSAPWPEIRAVFSRAGVQPTVFLTGYFIRHNPEVVRQMFADGYDIESHSDTHADLTTLSAEGVRQEFTGAQAALDEVLGAHVPMCLWRPPSGARNADVRRVAAEMGLLEIYWSQGGDTTGWRENATAERVYNRVIANLRPGQIYVMHINSEPDAEALPAIMAEMQAQGYTTGNMWSVLTPEQLGPLE